MLQLLLPMLHAILSNKFCLGQEQSLHKSPNSPLATHSLHSLHTCSRGCWWIVAMNLTLIGLPTSPSLWMLLTLLSLAPLSQLLLCYFTVHLSSSFPSFLLFTLPSSLSIFFSKSRAWLQPGKGIYQADKSICRLQNWAGGGGQGATATSQSQLCRRMKRSQHSMELSISDMHTDGNCAVDGFH